MTSKPKNKFTYVQLLWSLAGLLLFAAGCYLYSIPDGQLLPVAGHLGLAMFLAGSINILVYLRKKDEIHGSQWLLADGMSTALLAMFPLFNKMVLPVMIPFFFGVWELFSGILKIIESKELQAEKIPSWHWFMGIGCFELISGVMSMIKTIDDLVGYNHVISIILFVQSSGFLFKILMYHRLTEKYINQHSICA